MYFHSQNAVSGDKMVKDIFVVNWLTSWNLVLFEMPVVAQPLKFQAFY
jgi:hypothetical protein